MYLRRTHTTRSLAALVGTAVLLAGCSSGSASNEPSEPKGADHSTLTEGMIGEDSGGDPVRGGTFDWAGFAEPRSLDPAVTIAAGSTGGVEMANIFSTLMRYDSESQEFVPELAESLESSEDFTEWTLTLRAGVTFSDGTPMDAAAVKWSQERYVTSAGPESALWAANVTEISTPDERTVVYRLDSAWPMFASILSTGPGMIVAKSSDKGGEFTPVGAGPFTLDRWEPQEEMVLAANPDYWDGEPYLDEFRIVFLNDQDAAVESLDDGAVDAAMLRYPDVVDPRLETDAPGYLNLTAAGDMVLINAREGSPGEDVRVRQALAHALNPELVRQRAYSGYGMADSTLFPDYSRWHTDTEGLPNDPEKAKELLDQAKADGYDGKIRFLDSQVPTRRAVATAIKASLEAVGFEVELDLVRTVGDQITAIAVEGDYDLAGWGLAFREADPFSKMFATMYSSGTQVYGMYTSDEMDALIEEFQASTSEEDQLRVMDQVQQRLNEDVPFLTFASTAELNTWSEDVHGVIGAANSTFLLSKAWIED